MQSDENPLRGRLGIAGEKRSEASQPTPALGDFLIVTWTTQQLAVYARWLQEYDVPHQVTGGSAWDQVPELALLGLTLRAVTRPDDPIALVAVLRSELFGFSDRELYGLVQRGGRFHFHAPLPEGLPAESAARFADAFGRLQRHRRCFAEMPVVSAVEEMVADLGLAARAASAKGGNGRAGTLAKALEMLRAAQAELPSVTDLPGYLEELMDSREKFNGVPAWSNNGSVVRLMNLHQVKGLEAPASSRPRSFRPCGWGSLRPASWPSSPPPVTACAGRWPPSPACWPWPT